MLRIVACILNLVLAATGAFAYLRLDLMAASLAVGIAAVNVAAMFTRWWRPFFSVVAAGASLLASAQGTILLWNAVKVFLEHGRSSGETSLGDLMASGHDFSYAVAYLGAGLVTLVYLVGQANSSRVAPRRGNSEGAERA